MQRLINYANIIMKISTLRSYRRTRCSRIPLRIQIRFKTLFEAQRRNCNSPSNDDGSSSSSSLLCRSLGSYEKLIYLLHDERGGMEMKNKRSESENLNGSCGIRKQKRLTSVMLGGEHNRIRAFREPSTI